MKTKGRVVAFLTSICAIGDQCISWDYIEINSIVQWQGIWYWKIWEAQTQGWEYQLWKRLCKTKCDKFFNSPQRLNLVALNECEKNHNSKFFI